MRTKHTARVALAALCLSITATACGVLDKATDKKSDSAGAPAAAPATAGADAAKPTNLPGRLAAARTNSAAQKTYKTKADIEYDGVLASTVVTQVRVADGAQRATTTTYPAAAAAMGLPMRDTGPRTSESLVLPPYVYGTVPPVAGLDLDMKPWSRSKLSPKAAAELGSKDGEKGTAVTTLDKLRDSGDIHEVGNEAVDGVRATHYAGTVTVTRLLEQQGGTPESVAETRRTYEVLGMDSMTLDVWIGPNDLPVKMVVVTAMKFDKPVKAKATTTFSAWGAPVDLTPPPADQVEDLGDLPDTPFPAKPSTSPLTLPSATPRPTR